MTHFETMTDLREQPQDVSRLPHRQLASKVFGMTHAMFMRNWDHPMYLRPDVSPEMLEACVARIFGKEMHQELVVKLPQFKKVYSDCDGDDTYYECIHTKPLLGKIAEQSAWGSPATEDPEVLAHLLVMLMGPWGQNVDRFVAQAKQRITAH